MSHAKSHPAPRGIALGLICAALTAGAIWMVADGWRTGDWIQCAAAIFSGVFFLVGAVGGLLGPERLPDRSIADLVGWTCVWRVLDRPLRDWFTPRRSPR